jgi:2,3-bisphosphoglycerate-independent phosphoglycerate mutase
MDKKVIMLILDGWGLGKEDKFNAIANAKTPNIDRLIREYPNVALKSDGLAVGLPEGQYGTSEVNHQTIGAGRIIWQDLPRINKAIEDESFFENPALVGACNHVRENNSKLHIIGMISDGGVHCVMAHYQALIKMAASQKVAQLYIHAFSDGRDAPPQSVEGYMTQLESYFDHSQIGKVSTIQGRVFLDRDRDWERTAKAVELMVDGKGMPVNNYQAAVNFSYNQGTTDEFFEQFIIDSKGLIEPNDAVIFAHYRSDRIYQIQAALLERKLSNLFVAGFISASTEFDIHEAFPREHVSGTLGEALSAAGKKQFRITETEKFQHVTYFFNSGVESEMPGENWHKFNSERFVKPHYNFEPSMRVIDITKEIITKLEEPEQYDFILSNFVNCDMVGHTGSYEAAVIAAESVDYAVGKLYEALADKLDEYVLIITADHGNAEEMWDYESNQPHKQHTLNKVPFILVTNIKCRLERREGLEDVAPTILELIGVAKPAEMTGHSLLVHGV